MAGGTEETHGSENGKERIISNIQSDKLPKTLLKHETETYKSQQNSTKESENKHYYHYKYRPSDNFIFQEAQNRGIGIDKSWWLLVMSTTNNLARGQESIGALKKSCSDCLFSRATPYLPGNMCFLRGVSAFQNSLRHPQWQTHYQSELQRAKEICEGLNRTPVFGGLFLYIFSAQLG